jgi:hypothetical protein
MDLRAGRVAESVARRSRSGGSPTWQKPAFSERAVLVDCMVALLNRQRVEDVSKIDVL